MKFKPLPPQAYLNKCFKYLNCGTLIWKARPRFHFDSDREYEQFCARLIGTIAGTSSGDYLQVQLSYFEKDTTFKVHRIIWTMHNGTIPQGYVIDHWDTNKSNNSILNLRLALPMNNAHNTRINANNRSGVKGVGWDKRYKLWYAKVYLNYKQVYFEYFPTIDEAEKAVKAARIKLHKEFVNHG